MDEQNPQEQPVEGGYQPPGAPPPPPRNTDALVIWGFVLAGLGLLCCCCPPPFAIAAIVLGAIAYSRGDQRGLWVIIAGGVVLILGSTFSIVWHPWQWFENLPRQAPPGPWRRV